MLEMSDICVAFDGLLALDQLSFVVRDNSTTALIGPNGAGKTTVLRVAMGMLKPYRGDVWVRGMRITGLPPWRVAQLGIGHMFQVPRLFRQMTVLENVLVSMKYKTGGGLWGAVLRSKVAKDEARKKEQEAMQVLHTVGLQGKAQAMAWELSHGQMKRLALAQVLAPDPQILLLDEPSSGLDRQGVKWIMDTLNALRHHKRCILLVEHNLEVVQCVADTVIVLHLGREICAGSPPDVLRERCVVEAYLGG